MLQNFTDYFILKKLNLAPTAVMGVWLSYVYIVLSV